MTNRRNFLQAGGLGIAGLSLAASAVTAAEGTAKPVFSHDMGPESPDAQLWAKEGKHVRCALIGCGWYGKSDMFRLIQCGGDKVEVVAICDVNDKTLKEAGDLIAARQANGKVPKFYHDYRQLLDNEKVDICLVGTPDHWHALPMIAACEHGCDVYVQKPIACDVVECRAMLSAARRNKSVVQVGMQRRSTPILCDAKKKYIDSGLIGQVSHITMFCDYPQGKRVLQPETPPEELDFDFWTGPAPLRPYYDTYHLRRWRAFMEYGNGTIGDMGVHMYDMVRWLFNLGYPKKISSHGGIFVNKGGTPNIPDTQKCLFEYDNLTVEWEHRHWHETRSRRYGWGAECYGTGGTFIGGSMAYDWKPLGWDKEWVQVDAQTEYDQYPSDNGEPGLETRVASANRAHMWNFLARTVDRGRPVSDIEEGCISSACCILGNISLELGGATLEYDPETGTVLNNEKATAMLRREYRAPWVHPEV